jgi:hypothetical protein
MGILIEIETKEEELGRKLLEKVKDLPANIILKEVAQAQGVKGYPAFFLSLGIKVDTAFVAKWLFENIKDRAGNLRMDRTEVQIKQEEIAKTITGNIKKGANAVFTPHPPIHQKIKSPE